MWQNSKFKLIRKCWLTTRETKEFHQIFGTFIGVGRPSVHVEYAFAAL
jgi:hypothetical protein